jgi:D-allose transport system substrate-binding protein
MTLKRKPLAAVKRLLFCGAFLLCGHANTAVALDIAALISDTANPYWRVFEQGLREAAQNGGRTISISALRNATDAEAQLNQCEVALLKKPKAILVAAVRARTLVGCLRNAHAQGVIVVDVDGNISETLAQKLSLPVDFSVASDNYQLGKEGARYLASRLQMIKGKDIFILEGASGSEPNELRVRGFKENILPHAAIVGMQAADWDRARAATIIDQVLPKYPNISAIFAANDTMALGAVEALRAHGKSDVLVIGIDGSADAIRAIREGRLTASVAQLPYLMAKEAVEKVSLAISGNRPRSYQQFVPIVALDGEVLRSAQEPLLQYVR